MKEKFSDRVFSLIMRPMSYLLALLIILIIAPSTLESKVIVPESGFTILLILMWGFTVIMFLTLAEILMSLVLDMWKSMIIILKRKLKRK